MVKNVSDNGFSLAHYRDEIIRGNRVILSRAITLCESSLSDDQAKAVALIEELHAATGKSIRVGITGAPGVGKSTFIEAFGKHLTSLGKKVAILTIDPSSQKTKGSILGDKTRMEELSRDPSAYIRPTASGSSLGGVANATRESILLCEAAGFDIVIVETVGVGQSEVAVREMVDFFLLLMLAGAGDELQGIKKGIMEMADALAITKADGENITRAKQAKTDFKNALHLFQKPESGIYPEVLLTSGIEKTGVAETWKFLEDFIERIRSNGFFQQLRDRQNIQWFHEVIDHRVRAHLNLSVKQKIGSLEQDILTGKISPAKAGYSVTENLF